MNGIEIDAVWPVWDREDFVKHLDWLSAREPTPIPRRIDSSEKKSNFILSIFDAGTFSCAIMSPEFVWLMTWRDFRTPMNADR